MAQKQTKILFHFHYFFSGNLFIHSLCSKIYIEIFANKTLIQLINLKFLQ